jgi:DNA-directed RNA polymerase subunit RPC12/RpoP
MIKKMTRLERAIKMAYNEVLAKRGSLMGKHVRIGSIVQNIKEIYGEEFSKEQINKSLLKLFYNEHKIDLSPGNTHYFIEDNNGNTFGYMLWRHEGSLEDIEESHKNKEETKWFRCMNCWGEYRLEDLGLFITSEDNKLAYFCPVCGFWEFCTSEDAPHEEEIQDILEDGPDQVYEYPGKMIKPVKDKIYLENHEDMLNEYKARRRKELNEKTMEFKHLFNNS